MGIDSNLTSIPQFATLEIVKTGITSVPFASDGTTQTVTIAHGLALTPIVIAFLDEGGFKLPLPYMIVESSGASAGKVYQIVSCAADETNIYINNQSQLQGTAGGSVRYYILRERAQTTS